MSKLDDFLSKEGKGMIQKSGVHSAFSECDQVFKSTLGDPRNEEMALILGKVKDKEEFYLSFGGYNAPYRMKKNHMLYLVAAITKLTGDLVNKEYKEDLQKILKKGIKDGSCEPVVGIGSGGVKKKEITPEELKKFLDKVQKAKEVVDEGGDSREEMSEEYESAKKEISDFEDIVNSMTPEEQKILEGEAATKTRELLFDKAKALEKELLGEIVMEESVEYDYAYFKKIYVDKGAEHMREELAKIPKELRKAIIEKIVEEVKAEETARLE